MEKNKMRISSEEQKYIYGNTAPKIDYDYSVVEKQLESPIPVVEPKIAPRKQEKQRRDVHYKLNLLGAIFVVFAGCFLLMLGYSAITNQQKQLKDLSAQLQEIQNQNSIIKTEIAKNIDIDYVQKRAIEDLGMVEPASHQIIYIEVPKTSYTVRHTVESEKQANTFSVASFFNFLNKGRENK